MSPILARHFTVFALALLALAATPLHAQREKLPAEDLEFVEKKWPDAKRTYTGLRYVVLKPAPKGSLSPAEGMMVTVIYKGMLPGVVQSHGIVRRERRGQARTLLGIQIVEQDEWRHAFARKSAFEAHRVDAAHSSGEGVDAVEVALHHSQAGRGGAPRRVVRVRGEGGLRLEKLRAQVSEVEHGRSLETVPGEDTVFAIVEHTAGPRVQHPALALPPVPGGGVRRAPQLPVAKAGDEQCQRGQDRPSNEPETSGTDGRDGGARWWSRRWRLSRRIGFGSHPSVCSWVVERSSAGGMSP